MYVTPRPDVDEDPLYAVRLGLTGMLAYVAVPILNPALPPIIAALPLGLIAAQRRAFNPAKMIAAPFVMIVMVYAATWFFDQLRPMPVVYVEAAWLAYFLAFRMFLKTGAPLGMLIIIVALLMSIMGLHGTATLETMRDGFVQASLVALMMAWNPRPRMSSIQLATFSPSILENASSSTTRRMVGLRSTLEGRLMR